MGDKKKSKFKGTETINASEIGQFHYCSMAWFLQKCGYEPKSPMLDIGFKKHVELGEVIDNTQINIKKSRGFAIVGYILLIIAFLMIVFEVI